MGHLYHGYVSANQRVNHHCSRLNRSQWKQIQSHRWVCFPAKTHLDRRAGRPFLTHPTGGHQAATHNGVGRKIVDRLPVSPGILMNPGTEIDVHWMTLELKSLRAQFIEINCALGCVCIDTYTLHIHTSLRVDAWAEWLNMVELLNPYWKRKTKGYSMGKNTAQQCYHEILQCARLTRQEPENLKPYKWVYTWDMVVKTYPCASQEIPPADMSLFHSSQESLQLAC